MQTLTVLGSTGSIGCSTLDIVSRHPDRYAVFALTANARWEELARQCEIHRPVYAVIKDESSAAKLRARLSEKDLPVEVLSGESGLISVASNENVDTVMAAIVGAAGLAPTLAAVESGKRVLLANKESLVMAGALFMEAVAKSGATLLPIDSEHNAIFQCLPAPDSKNAKPGMAGVKKILLSASGGPFRTMPLDMLPAVTPEQACAHPNWSMGQKISVDSATMMNKGLELIEACWLFDVSPNQVEIVIHPQSIVHSLVEYVDGSVIAQLGNPDMRTPIAHAMAWPERIESGVSSLDLVRSGDLSFESPNLERFPCLKLAIGAALRGGNAPIVLNAANEVAVENFLLGRIGFTQIAELVEYVLDEETFIEPESLLHVYELDRAARECALRYLAGR
ncbi:MAG: 1-deoxy-D-xylulose-5-phosphate reductoisomerase [bacterium]